MNEPNILPLGYFFYTANDKNTTEQNLKKTQPPTHTLENTQDLMPKKKKLKRQNCQSRRNEQPRSGFLSTMSCCVQLISRSHRGANIEQKWLQSRSRSFFFFENNPFFWFKWRFILLMFLTMPVLLFLQITWRLPPASITPIGCPDGRTSLLKLKETECHECWWWSGDWNGHSFLSASFCLCIEQHVNAC